MGYVLFAFAVLVIIVLLMYKSPRVGVNPVASWNDLQKMLSVKIAALAGFLATAIPTLEQLNNALPQIEAVSALHGITSSDAYKTFVGILPFIIILARSWKQGSTALAQTEEKKP